MIEISLKLKTLIDSNTANRLHVCYRRRGRRYACGGALGRQSHGREDLRGFAELSDVPAESQKIHRALSPGGPVEGKSDGRSGVAVRDDRQQELHERRRKPM